jgi:CDP-diacylglycerol---glycerol-3-phosphate 3-phosphatidyltransferase
VVCRRWLEATGGLVAITSLIALSIAAAWSLPGTVEFVGWTAAALLAVAVVVGLSLERTVTNDAAGRLTFASWLTLVRGSTLAVFVGTLAVVDVGTGASEPVAWLPALFFAVTGLLDVVDGAVARRTDSVTDLGARLDIEFDALTAFVGAAAVVVVGGAHPAFLAVGAARYLYVWSLWLRRRRDRPVRELPSSRVRVPLFVAVLLAIWVALTPIASGPWTVALTTVVAVPFLANFTWDWLVATTRVEP